LLAVLLAIPLTLLAIAGLLAGTQTGTRWLIGVAEPYLPQQLEIGTSTGTLLRGMELDGIRWIDEGTRVIASGVAANAALLPLLDREIRITNLRIDRLDVTLPAAQPEDESGAPPEIRLPIAIRLDAATVNDIRLQTQALERRIRRIFVSGRFVGSRLLVDRLNVESDWMDLDFEGRVGLANRYPANISARWRFQASDDSPELSGTLAVSGDRRGYDVRHELTAPVSIATRGSVNAEADVPVLDLRNTWSRIDWPLGDRQLSLGDGELTARGRPDDLAIRLLTAGRVDQLPETGVDFTGRLTPSRLDIEGLRLDGELGQLDIGGDLGWGPTASFDLAAQARNLDPGLLSPQLSGDVELRGSASGRLEASGWIATVIVDALEGTLNGQPLAASADVGIADRNLTVREAEIAVGENTLAASGEIADTLALSAAVDFRRLEQLDERLSGTLSGDMTLSGSRDDPAVALQLVGRQTAWSTLSADRLQIDVSLRSRQSGALTLAADNVAAGSIVATRADFELDGQPDRHRYSLTADNPDGRLELTGNGRLGDGRWDGRLEAVTLDTAVLNRWALSEPIELSAAESAVSVSSFCFLGTGSAGRLCGQASFEAARGGEFDLTIRELPLAALPLTLPAGIDLNGSLRSDLAIRLADGNIDGTASAALVDATIDAVYEDEPYSLDVTAATIDADIDANRLQSRIGLNLGNGGAVLAATAGIEDIRATGSSAIAGEASVSVPDASVFAFLLPDISDLHGQVDGTLAASGNLQAPGFTGELALSDASFAVRAAGIGISDLNLRLRQLDAGRLQLTGSAESGEGSIEIEGETAVGLESGLSARMRVRGDRFELLRLPDTRVAASPDITLVLDEQTAAVTGSIFVPAADITVKQIPETAARPSGDVIVHGGAEQVQRKRRIDVDIDASLGDEVRLSGFGLTTRMTGGVRLVGGTGRPYTGTGSLQLSEGRYKAYGQDLEIETGELIFNGPLSDPQLNVRAIRRIDTADVIAGIRVSGTPRSLRSEVFSDPPLGDAEALSYLLTGRPLSGPTDSDDADLLNKAAFALGLSQAGSIASQIRGDLGLDTLAIEGGAESGRIVAGKRLGDRLAVEYGYDLVDKLGTLLLRYQLTSRLILESRTGTVSEFDVIYSVKRE
jgi:translocation and assembly module TamB